MKVIRVFSHLPLILDQLRNEALRERKALKETRPPPPPPVSQATSGSSPPAEKNGSKKANGSKKTSGSLKTKKRFSTTSVDGNKMRLKDFSVPPKKIRLTNIRFVGLIIKAFINLCCWDETS